MKIFFVSFFSVFLLPLLNTIRFYYAHTISVLYWAHLCMKTSLGISNFLEEISSFSHSIVFFYLFALVTEEGFLISPCYSLELCIHMGISFLFSFAFQFNSVQLLSRVSFQPHELQHARPPCLSPIPGVPSNSCPLSRWCHPAISSSVISFFSCPQSFPASGSFPMNQLFASGGQSIEALVSASLLPMNIQGWLPLGLTSLIYLLSREFSRLVTNLFI